MIIVLFVYVLYVYYTLYVQKYFYRGFILIITIIIRKTNHSRNDETTVDKNFVNILCYDSFGMPTALKLGTSEKFKAMTFYTRTCNTNLRIQFPRYFLSIFFNHFSNIIYFLRTREKRLYRTIFLFFWKHLFSTSIHGNNTSYKYKLLYIASMIYVI